MSVLDRRGIVLHADDEVIVATTTGKLIFGTFHQAFTIDGDNSYIRVDRHNPTSIYVKNRYVDLYSNRVMKVPAGTRLGIRELVLDDTGTETTVSREE